MKTLKLKVYREDPETGEMRLWGKKQLEVTGANVDEAMQKARALLVKEGLPPVRSINVSPGEVLTVYCGQIGQRADKPTGQLDPRKPPRLKKL